MAKGDSAPEEGTVAIEFFARIYGLNAERIRQLIKEGWIPRGPRGRVKFIESIQGMDRYRQDQVKRAKENSADHRIRDFKAREMELKIAHREGSLIDYDEVLSICQELFGTLKSEFDGLAASVTRERELRHRIEDRVNGALGRVAKRLDGWTATGRLSQD